MNRRRFLPSISVLALALATAASAQTGNDGSVDFAAPMRPLTLADAVPGKDGVKRAVILRGLDKISGQATIIFAPVGVPVRFATLTIVAHYCYSTPPIETPETTAFIQIDDHRPDELGSKRIYSGWVWASSPSLHPVDHPLYDVWVISCKTNEPGQVAPTVASTAPVKTISPDAGAKEEIPELPEGAGQ